MSLEKLAFENIRKRHPSAIKNGLTEVLKKAFGDSHDEGMLSARHGFIPDATMIEGDTITLFEIEDTSKLTSMKMDNIQLFGMNLFDLTEHWCRLVVTDRYGMNETEIWTSREDVV